MRVRPLLWLKTFRSNWTLGVIVIKRTLCSVNQCSLDSYIRISKEVPYFKIIRYFSFSIFSNNLWRFFFSIGYEELTVLTLSLVRYHRHSKCTYQMFIDDSTNDNTHMVTRFVCVEDRYVSNVKFLDQKYLITLLFVQDFKQFCESFTKLGEYGVQDQKFFPRCILWLKKGILVCIEHNRQP